MNFDINKENVHAKISDTDSIIIGLEDVLNATKYKPLFNVTGFDNVDINAASERNIIVCNTPDYGIDEVSDTTCAFILNAIRQIAYYEKELITESMNEYHLGNVVKWNN